MILVFGKTGQVATELQRILPTTVFLGRADSDLFDPNACACQIRDLKPEAVVNAATYTAVEKAEDDALVARAVNAEAPTEMARACAELGIPFIHISTDYVFDGTGKTSFAPDHPTAPLSIYGQTKLEGENGVRNVGGTYAILRTSWVFSAHGSNFVKTMLRLSKTRDKLTVVGDQIGGPTPVRDIAKACVEIAKHLRTEPNKTGIYHFSGAQDVSWADFAREILPKRAGRLWLRISRHRPIRPPQRVRPIAVWKCSTTQAAFGIERPDWKSGLAEILSELETAL